MAYPILLALALLWACAPPPQKRPIYLTKHIADNAGPVGPEFAAAVKRQLERSTVYKLVSTREVPKQGILFHLNIVVNCQFHDCLGEEKAMAFADMETLGRAAWPLPDQWYEREFVVRRGHVDEAAARLLADAAAVWCGMSHYNSAAAMAACPKELLPPWP